MATLLEPSFTETPLLHKDANQIILREKEELIALSAGYALFTKTLTGEGVKKFEHAITCMEIEGNMILLAFENGELRTIKQGALECVKIDLVPLSMPRPMITEFCKGGLGYVSVANEGELCSYSDSSSRFSISELTDKANFKVLRIVPLLGFNFSIFFFDIQKLQVFQWLEEGSCFVKSVHPTHELSSSTVDYYCEAGVLYSLTHDGIISKWEALKERRLIRVAVHETGLQMCRKLVTFSGNRFVIQTANKLVFVVV